MNKKNPNYAIIKIPDSANVVQFYQLLVENGFAEVSFVNEVRENAFLPYSNEFSMSLLKNSNVNPILPLKNFKTENNEIGTNNISITQIENKSNSVTTSTNESLLKQLSDSNENVLKKNESILQSDTTKKITSTLTDVKNNVKNAALINGLTPTSLSTKFDNSLSSFNSNTNNNNNNSSLEIFNKTVHHNTQKLVSITPSEIVNTLTPKSHKDNHLLSSVPNINGFIVVGPNTTIDEEGIVYATCQLCHNRIMSSRLSNLTNHVRRHAAMKQYQCPYCSYCHNEMAKVRLHMNHNHRDFKSQPIDALCFEMQLQWSLLMEQCFPEHAKRSKDADVWKLATNVPSSSLNNGNAQLNVAVMPKTIQPDSIYTCVECGEMLNGTRLIEHLKDSHRSDCRPFSCSECGYQNAKQWKVRLHISVKHSERAVEARADQLPSGNWPLFIHRFFPQIPADEEEEKMIAQLRDIVNNDSVTENLTNNFFVEEFVKCSLCETNNSVFYTNPVSNLINHAKHHYVVKQYRCPECAYACDTKSTTILHIRSIHKTDKEPLNLLTEDFKAALINLAKRCFPKLQIQINDYKFKDTDFCEDAIESYINNKINNNASNNKKQLKILYNQSIKKNTNLSQNIEPTIKNKLLLFDNCNVNNSAINNSKYNNNFCDNEVLLILNDDSCLSPRCNENNYEQKNNYNRKKSISSNDSIQSQNDERSITPLFVDSSEHLIASTESDNGNQLLKNNTTKRYTEPLEKNQTSAQKKIKIEMTEKEIELNKNNNNQNKNVQLIEDSINNEELPRRSNRTFQSNEKRITINQNKNDKILNINSLSGTNQRKIRNSIRKQSQ